MVYLLCRPLLINYIVWFCFILSPVSFTNMCLYIYEISWTIICFLYCSSEATKSRAKELADEVGSWHLDVPIDGVVSALLSLFQSVTGKRPRYKVIGKTLQYQSNLFFYFFQGCRLLIFTTQRDESLQTMTILGKKNHLITHEILSKLDEP